MKIQKSDQPKPASGLYLVATPIGNLRDISLRALDVLQAADLIVCEDTRVSGRLLEAYAIGARLLPYNDHNAVRQRPKIIEELGEGKLVALISDAGTPLVSDPGYKLVRDCLDLGIMVTSVPGPCAPVAALQLSGLPSDKFVFLGFLPPKSKARQTLLAGWKAVPATLVMFESAGRVTESLKDMAKVLGDRQAALVREITKKFEESRRGPLSLLAEQCEAEPPRGEIVVVVAPPDGNTIGPEELDDMIRAALKTMSVKDAAAFVAESSGQSKKTIYERALELGRER